MTSTARSAAKILRRAIILMPRPVMKSVSLGVIFSPGLMGA